MIDILLAISIKPCKYKKLLKFVTILSLFLINSKFNKFYTHFFKEKGAKFQNSQMGLLLPSPLVGEGGRSG